MSEQRRPAGPGRRELFTAIGAAAVAGAAGWVLRGTENSSSPQAAPPTGAPSPSAEGVAGITSPSVPQRHLHVRAVAFPDADPDDIVAAGRALAALAPEAPDDAGDVTITVGYAPALALRAWPERAALARDLPVFAGDAGPLDAGDIVVQVCAETAAAVRDTAAAILDHLDGAEIVWERTGYRDAPTAQGTARTNTGFVDGIVNPRTPAERNEGVWTPAGDTYAVYRRMTIAPDFLRLPVPDQEAAIGRRRDSGAPLSGGGAMDEIDLFAKSAAGRPLVPAAAHVRRAHPANIGRPLMLRRSYSFDLDEGAGLLFAAFMNDPETFVTTQHRLDEMDDLIRSTSTDAAGCYFVPAGGR
ncbi:Dyp-type peroxidase [Microbacterium sp. NPDC055683]